MNERSRNILCTLSSKTSHKCSEKFRSDDWQGFDFILYSWSHISMCVTVFRPLSSWNMGTSWGNYICTISWQKVTNFPVASLRVFVLLCMSYQLMHHCALNLKYKQFPNNNPVINCSSESAVHFLLRLCGNSWRSPFVLSFIFAVQCPPVSACELQHAAALPLYRRCWSVFLTSWCDFWDCFPWHTKQLFWFLCLKHLKFRLLSLFISYLVPFRRFTYQNTNVQANVIHCQGKKKATHVNISLDQH